jgi:hypothetical protein
MKTLSEALASIDEFGPNCLLGVCCPPVNQESVLANMIDSHFGWTAHPGDNAVAREVANFILDHFDLAPKDSITPLLRLAGKLAVDGTP